MLWQIVVVLVCLIVLIIGFTIYINFKSHQKVTKMKNAAV